VPAIAATTAPVLVVLSKDEVMPVMAKAVVVAFVVVELPTMTRLPLMVEEALLRKPAVVSPPLKAIEVVVALEGNG